MPDISYKNHVISLRTEPFGNGTAVEVLIDGEKALDLYNAQALFATEPQALQGGERFAREAIERGLQSFQSQPHASTEETSEAKRLQ